MQLQALRKELHKIAELSGKEYKTAKFVIDKLNSCNPTKIYSKIGETGVLGVWQSNNFDKTKHKTICFRAELDALPIPENNSFDYKSLTNGVSHKCGHDGHMSILLGLAHHLKNHLQENKKIEGKVVLLFQSAEETGEGALNMLRDEKMTIFLKENPIDYIFALHNIPSYPKNLILCRENTFTAASTGMIVEFEGHTSHAAEPQNGNNPALAMGEMTAFFYTLYQDVIQKKENKGFVLSTVVDAILGETSRKSLQEIAFGTSPAKARVCATLRSYLNEDLEFLKQKSQQKANALAQKYNLQLRISYSESFAATTNTSESVILIEKIAQKLGLEYQNKETPFSWSEDFGQFTEKFRGAMFGLGAGENTPELHHSNYDFPDEITQNGVDMFLGLMEEVLKRAD